MAVDCTTFSKTLQNIINAICPLMCCRCLSDICLLLCWQICWLSPDYFLLRWVHLSKLFRFIQSTPRNIKSTMEYLEYTKLYSPGAFSDHCCSRWPLYYLGTISRLSRRYLQTTQHDIKYSQSTDIISNIAKIKWSIIKITSDIIQIIQVHSEYATEY